MSPDITHLANLQTERAQCLQGQTSLIYSCRSATFMNLQQGRSTQAAWAVTLEGESCWLETIGSNSLQDT